MNRIKLICRLAFVMLLALTIVVGVYAAEPKDIGTVTIECVFDKKPVPSLSFSLYHVANVSGSQITMDANFSTFPVDLKAMDVESWNELAYTVKCYVIKYGLDPDASGKSDANGSLTVNDLSAGLYLVVGKDATVNQKCYSSAPFFVLIPRTVAETGEVFYDQTVYPKLSVKSVPVDTTTREVQKRWDDRGYEDERPSEITITLYCDKMPWDSVTLSEANDWHYTWEQLEDNHEYTVSEDEIDGYTVAIEPQGNTFTVTNKYSKPPQPIHVDTLSPIGSDSDPTDSTSPAGSSGNKLPSTGLNWWPVLIFAVLGLLCLAAGILWRKEIVHEEKK